MLLFCITRLQAQEYTAPLRENPDLLKHGQPATGSAARPTLLGLPFFEDFTDHNAYPSPLRWTDQLVYINNTMGVNMISRGVATFDALDKRGVPYDSVVAYHQVYADSLTSQPVDMSSYSPADSVYLSFFYQPKGNGFSPRPADSLMLYLLKSNGTWEKVWSMKGDTLLPFRQAMIPITDTGYFNNGFQFRWVNLATKGIGDSHWHLDYIRLDKGRTYLDTAVRDIAFTSEPLSILNDFTAMPFRHFKTNPASFLATELNCTLRNNGNVQQNVLAGYVAKVKATGASLGTGTANSSLPVNVNFTRTFPMYNAGGFSPADPNGAVVYEHTYYCNSNYPGESKVNDTTVFSQVFDQYFAYDDGSAEQAYFLNLLPSAPGTTAVEYAVYQPDTLRGIAIRFARQVPAGTHKEFSIVVYKDIAFNGGSNQVLYQEDFLLPAYEDTANKLSVYRFEQPQLLSTGVFYIGIIQPAGGISDSLYIALDVNRKGGNHRYYNVDGTWQSSQLDGALLLRPLVGPALPVTGIADKTKTQLNWSLAPNPASDYIHIQVADKGTFDYRISDVQGRILDKGRIVGNADIPVGKLSPGMYFIQVGNGKGYAAPRKLLKL
ncbi:T9SS type A sorting domain-containing protein [Taibaiella chishuiensis]|uniref:T9SS type A sorting domain-containing protein n=1 Tax=Taibaiella chishuiensis TaxID=1434707 RepID=UPI0015E75403|nr:T9SS type A sorting domain-containing protein [Taibaiella chishuiensis]